MDMAINLAKRAQIRGEVPIGAVIVRHTDGKIIARTYNLRERTQNALHHAEILAIHRACRRLKSWRLDNCDIYVTLEPCQMCLGAITNARIRHLYYGASSTTDLNHKVAATNLDIPECSALLKDFFKSHR